MLTKDVHTVSGAGTAYSTPVAARGRTQLSVQLEYTGTLATTTSLWASNRHEPDLTDDGDWVEKTDVTFAGASGSAASEEVPVSGANALWYRLKHVTASGSGTIRSDVHQVLAATAS